LNQALDTLRTAPPEALERFEPRRSTARVLDAWDVVGLLAAVAVMALVATWGAVRADPGYRWLPEALFALGVGSALVAAASSLALARRFSLDAKSLPLRSTRIWLDPPHDSIMFALGFVLALPALALHSDVHSDPDSARLIAGTMDVQRNGLGFLVETQDNLLPHVTMGPLLALGGIPAAKLFSILSVQALAGVVSFLAWKLTRSAGAALVAVVALLAHPLVWERAYVLPLYPLMLLLGFLGLYFSLRAASLDGTRQTWAAILAGSCFVLSFEANRIGQFFLVFTLFLFLTAPWRRAAHALARVYLVVAVLSIPRAAINLWDGGLDHFFSNRLDHWTTEGHLARVQQDFFGHPAGHDLPTYLARLGGRVDSLFGWSGLLVLALALIGLVLLHGRARWFALSCVATFVAVAVLYRQIPFYPRYFSPLMVAGAIGAGVGVHLLLRRSTPLKAAAVGACLALFVGAGTAYVEAVDGATHRQAEVRAAGIPRIANAIDDRKGVIGTRSGHLLFVNPELKTYGGMFLSEEEYVTYLTWPSDREVIDLLRTHDIGWVLLIPERRLEVRYHNTWLQPAHGKTVRHVQAVAASPNFCRVRWIQGYVLYKLGPCPS
jgi:hypothetical protein